MATVFLRIKECPDNNKNGDSVLFERWLPYKTILVGFGEVSTIVLRGVTFGVRAVQASRDGFDIVEVEGEVKLPEDLRDALVILGSRYDLNAAVAFKAVGEVVEDFVEGYALRLEETAAGFCVKAYSKYGVSLFGLPPMAGDDTVDDALASSPCANETSAAGAEVSNRGDKDLCNIFDED